MTFKTQQALLSALELIRQSPTKQGRVQLIVRRPEVDQREIMTQGELSESDGLIGDNWLSRGNRKTPDKTALLDAQITVMNARVIQAIAEDEDRWPLAGDQFFVDFDLSANRLPAGTRLSIGEALIEVTAEPHLGCRKFSERFGKEATLFVNSDIGKQLNARGINARVVRGGRVSVGDLIQIHTD